MMKTSLALQVSNVYMVFKSSPAIKYSSWMYRFVAALFTAHHPQLIPAAQVKLYWCPAHSAVHLRTTLPGILA